MPRSFALLGVACALAALGGCGSSGDGSSTSLKPLFGPPVITELGDAPLSLVYGDINADGRMDVVATLRGGAGVVLLGNGDGTFQAGRVIGDLEEVRAAAIGDIDNDGKADIVAIGCQTRGCSPSLFVLRGNGDGTFRSPVAYPSVSGASAVAIGDFNRDGHPDVVVGHNSAVVFILLGRGDGSLQDPTEWSTASSASLNVFSVAVTDVNADGKQDIVVFQGGGLIDARVSVLLGRGDGSFDPPVDSFVDQFPQSSAIADFNRDGWTDVVFNGSRVGTQPGPGLLAVLLGKGDGTFGPPIHPYDQVVFGAGGFAVGDIDGDGKPDLVLRVSDTDPLKIFRGNGDGTFAAAQDFAPGLDAAPVDRLVDINDDKRLDLVLRTASGFAVLFGNR